MVLPRREGKGFTLVELLVVIAVIALLLAILMPVLGRASKAARSARCKATLSQMFKGVRVYLNNYDEYFPLAWHTGGTLTDDLGNLTFARIILQEQCMSGFHRVVTDRDVDRFGTPQAAKEEKFRDNAKFWKCSDRAFTNDYFASHRVFKWPGYPDGPEQAGSDDDGPYDKHRTLSEVSTQAVPDSKRPLFTDVNASLPNDEAEDPLDMDHQDEMRNGYSYRTVSGIDVFVGVGRSLRDLDDWDTTRFDFRHNNSINVLFLDSHVADVKKTNRKLLSRIHRRWNSITVTANED